MEYTIPSEKQPAIKPRIILHGGAGRISHDNLPQELYNVYKKALLDILDDADYKLQLPGATALDIATHAVTLLENNGRFNSGHGAVYTTTGKHELEASVMVSRGYRKRGVGVMGVTRARNPIKLAREMLIRGEEEDGGGAHGHVQLHGETCDRLAKEWELETVRPSYFWTKRRWDEHRKDLGLTYDRKTYEREKLRADRNAECEIWPSSRAAEDSTDISWDGKEYLSQGTVGAVVMDSTGTICVATSTGGITNKLPGRIGDTPTLGAGFWAEEWNDTRSFDSRKHSNTTLSPLSRFLMDDCLPWLNGDDQDHQAQYQALGTKKQMLQTRRAAAMSGTGNGDSFLRLAATRTAAAMARFSCHPSSVKDSSALSLQSAVSHVAGPGGMLQQSAENRWLKTGEGEGGIIGIELKEGKGEVVFDFNCGGMFHVWVGEDDRKRFQVFRGETDIE